MAKVIYYGKPGCINGTKQIALLTAAGHELEVRDLLAASWTVDTLRPFFGSLPVVAWFNPSAPRLKSGEIDPSSLDEATALALLLEDPLLIRRPLLYVDGAYRVGFDPRAVNDWIGLTGNDAGDLETCPRLNHER
jgi:nitrogenase-associated protein